MTVLEKPWLNSYKLEPYKLDLSLAPYPELPLYQLLDQAAASYPNQTAVLFEGRELKYYQLKSQSDRLAAALTRLGVHKGDRVCLFLPNCLEYVLCYWAVLKAGGVVVPTSILRSLEGLVYELRESGARLLVCREGLSLAACSAGPLEPAPLDTRNEACASCRMAVSDARFAAQLVAPGELARFFDDLGCLASFVKAGRAPQGARPSSRTTTHEGLGARRPGRLHPRAGPRDADGLPPRGPCGRGLARPGRRRPGGRAGAGR